VVGLAGRKKPREASLTLRRGEVVGIAGLLGAGRTELLRLIFGLDPVAAGTIKVLAVSGPSTPAARIAQGVGFASEDRQGEGLATGLSIEQNITLSHLRRLGPFGFVSPSQKRAAARKWMERLGVRATGPDQTVRDLSGGNQQKVALGRLLCQGADIFLLDEPTRGIDVTSKSQIYALIDELAASGSAVLVVSSYLPELLGICDRIAVMRRGHLGPFRPASERTEHEVLMEATGA
jgi:ribose transport system ATP-binding protein